MQNRQLTLVSLVTSDSMLLHAYSSETILDCCASLPGHSKVKLKVFHSLLLDPTFGPQARPLPREERIL